MNNSELIPLWDQLRTSVDNHGYSVSLNDPKAKPDSKTIFIEEKDPFAIAFYKRDTKAYEQGLTVRTIPNKPDIETVTSNENTPGLVASVLINNDAGVRATPYTFLGKGYTELDVSASYFHILGLLRADKIEEAKQVIGNITYMVGHTYSLKATNRIYHQHVRALPLYTSMVRNIAEALPPGDRANFLKIHVARAILDYFRNWHAADQQLVDGLNVYPKTEVDPNTLSFKIPEEHIVPVRLNMMLYKTEMDIAHFIANHVEGGMLTVGEKEYDSAFWKSRAAERLRKMNNVLWNAERQTFNDYDHIAKNHVHVHRADFVYALWAGALDQTSIAGTKKLLASHTGDNGLVYDLQNQIGQAPEQIIAWEGLAKYGLDNEANELKAKWQKMVRRSYKSHGIMALRYHMANGVPVPSYGTLYGWTLASLFL